VPTNLAIAQLELGRTAEAIAGLERAVVIGERSGRDSAEETSIPAIDGRRRFH
jgi:hypothetical protein